MSQVFAFKVVGIEGDGDCAVINLRGKAHPVYQSPIFLRVPLSELSKFVIGDSYSLSAQDSLEDGSPMVETIPLGEARSRFDEWDQLEPAEEGEL